MRDSDRTGATTAEPIPITRPEFGAEEERLVLEVLRSGWVAQGSKVAAFEQAFAAFTGAKHALAVSSGTTALHVALVAAGIGTGDVVLVPAFTWVASANVVAMTGAKPVFVDIDPTTFTIDAKSLEFALSGLQNPGHIGVMPVSLFGQPINYELLFQSAKRESLIVIEDAACAVGAFHDGRHAGREAALACFSFHPRKTITTGEGGMVITDDDTLAEAVKSLRNHGTKPMVPPAATPSDLSDHDRVGYNYRLTDLQGAVGVAQMAKLNQILEQRRLAARRYDQLLNSLDYLTLPTVIPGGDHAWQAYVVIYRGREVLGSDVKPVDLSAVAELHKERNALMAALDQQGIATRPGTQAVHALEYYRRTLGTKPPDCPIAFAVEQLSIALPLFPDLTEADQERVADALRSACQTTV